MTGADDKELATWDIQRGDERAGLGRVGGRDRGEVQLLPPDRDSRKTPKKIARLRLRYVGRIWAGSVDVRAFLATT